MIIPEYPKWAGLVLEMRHELFPCFSNVKSGISEYTFANLFLFRNTYGYKVSRSPEGYCLFNGSKKGQTFFIAPVGIPGKEILDDLFRNFDYLKGASEEQLPYLSDYLIEEDRDNFDYLYLRTDLAELKGRKFHKKRNLVNAFTVSYPTWERHQITLENIDHARSVLEEWKNNHTGFDDYEAARDALNYKEELKLSGEIVYVDNIPAGYTLGEELGVGNSFAIHFEKAVNSFKGIYQFVNKCFASYLPEKYEFINREQDLGDLGLRQAKERYRPVGFVKKYIARQKG